MIKVFLVEDEIIMREGIKKNINWKEEGFEFVGEASDGELAYPLIQKSKPDILITDIKMPFMDGLELSRLVKKELPQTKIMILSGYDEFDYAKEAINIGVTDYLVKPITGAKLLEAVKRVGETILDEREKKAYYDTFKREMEESVHLERMKFFNDLVSNKLSVSESLERGKKLNLDLLANRYNIILFKVFQTKENTGEYSEDLVTVSDKIREAVEERTEILMFDRNTEGWAFLIKETEKTLEEIWQEFKDTLLGLIREFFSLEYFGGVGMPVSRLCEISKSFDEANKAFAYRYIIEKNQIAYYNSVEDYQLIRDTEINLSSLDVGKIDRKIVDNFLKSGSKDEIDHFIERYFLSLGEKNTNSLIFRQYLAMDIYFATMSFIESLGYESQQIVQKCGDIHKMGTRMSTLENTKEQLKILFQEAIELRELVSLKKYSTLLMKAKQYIRDNFQNEDISLNKAAASVNISPSHFSAIFSQEQGETFIEYLTSVRMEKAKELLKCSGMKSSEIAYAVGYKDPHYFSYLFKKTQNCTPKEFRLRG